MKRTMTGFLTALAMFMATAVPACAGEMEYHDGDSASVPITATVSSSYAVVLPVTARTLTDEDNDGIYTGTIGFDVYGKINSDMVLVLGAGETNKTATYTKTFLTTDPSVTADGNAKNTFTMTGQTNNETVTGAVAQEAVRFLSAPSTAETTFDRVISTSKAATAPYEVAMAISITKTDVYDGTMQFYFGLQSK